MRGLLQYKASPVGEPQLALYCTSYADVKAGLSVSSLTVTKQSSPRRWFTIASLHLKIWSDRIAQSKTKKLYASKERAVLLHILPCTHNTGRAYTGTEATNPEYSALLLGRRSRISSLVKLDTLAALLSCFHRA